MEKSNAEFCQIWTSATNGRNTQQVLQVSAAINNAHGYANNASQYSQTLPSAPNDFSSYGHGGYINPQQYICGTIGGNTFPGNASNSLHRQVLPQASNTFNPYGHGHVILPSASNDFSSNAHREYSQNWPSASNAFNSYGNAGYMHPQPTICVPAGVNTFAGRASNAQYSQSWPSVSNGLSSYGHAGYAHPQPICGPVDVNTFAGHANSLHRQILPPASNTNANGDGSFIDASHVLFANEDKKKEENSHRNLNVERLNLIPRIKNCYNNLTAKQSNLFDKDDWLQLTYITKNGLKTFKAHMRCPICRKEVCPTYRNSWEFGNIRRHLKNTHPEMLKEIEKENGSFKNAPLLEIEDSSDVKEDSVKPSPVSTSVIDDRDDNAAIKESDDISVKKDSIEQSLVSANGADLTPEKSKREKRGSSLENEVERKKDSSSSNSSSSWSSDSESDGTEISSELEHYESKREKSVREKPKREKILEKEQDKRKRVKISKHMSSTSSSSWSSDSETDVSVKGAEVTPKKTKREMKRPKITSHESKRNRRGKSPKRSRLTEVNSKKSEATPEWKKPGVKYSWVKFSEIGKCQPGFIFPRDDKKSKPLAKYITLKGVLSVSKHPIECKVDYNEVPLRVKKQYARALKIFNEENNSNYQ